MLVRSDNCKRGKRNGCEKMKEENTDYSVLGITLAFMIFVIHSPRFSNSITRREHEVVYEEW